MISSTVVIVEAARIVGISFIEVIKNQTKAFNSKTNAFKDSLLVLKLRNFFGIMCT